ncbi:MAG: mechanosensitive ion channel family protein [Bacillus sp. (in: firmicutes)]
MTFEVFIHNYLDETGIAIAIFLLFLILRKIFAKYVFKLLLKLSKKVKTTLLTSIFTAFEKPLQWLFIIIGFYVTVQYYPLFNQSNPVFWDILRSGIVIIISWGLYNLTASSSHVFDKLNDKYSFEIDAILVPFISRILRVIIVIIAISVVAQEFGYEVSTFVAGLGIGGLAISLAAKDAIANLFGGFVIITERPFTIGDWIKTPAVEGTVEEITFRSTRIRTFADAVVTVPNATLANDSITNWSKMGKRQIEFQLSVTYDTPRKNLENVVQDLRELLVNHSDVHKDTILVSFDQYKENGYGIFIYFFTNTTVWAEFLKVKEEINFEIISILEKQGVQHAIPSRRLSVDNEMELQLKKETVANSGS